VPMHLIPQYPQLWKIDRFEAFIDARKKLIRTTLVSLLAPAANPPLGAR